jgi:glutathione S-transferase
MAEFKLTYFDFSGSRGEECRLALHLEGTLSQCNAILVYVGRRFGLHPSDPWEAAKHEEVLCAGEDFRAKVAAVLFQKLEGEERKRAREELARGTMQTWGAAIEALLGEGPFVGGGKLQVADLKLHMLVRWFASGTVDHIPGDVFAGFPKLQRVHEAVLSDPRVAAWREQHA